MAEPKRPSFRPTKQQARDIFYTLNGDSNEFPVEIIDPKFLTLPCLKSSNVLNLMTDIFIETWGDKSKEYYDLLLLESSLPCKQQQFEIFVLSRRPKILSLVSYLNRMKTALNNEHLTLKEVDELVKGRITAETLALNSLVESWDKNNLTFERGVGVKYSGAIHPDTGRPHNEREMTECTRLMALVKQALEEDVGYAKRERRPLTPGHAIRLRVWQEQKGIYDSFKRKAKAAHEKMDKVLVPKELDPESAFGIPVGSSKTKRRKNKKRKTLRYKNKRK